MNLTHEQQKAIELPIPGTSLVCACAGAGKTRVLVERYKRMVEQGVSPASIVVVTFTVRAASELKGRIEGADLPLPLYVGTVHGYCTRFLPDGVSVAPEEVAKHAEEWVTEAMPGEAFPSPDEIARGEESRAYSAYKNYLLRNAMMDFDMLLDHAVNHGQGNDELHVLVDEIQDASPKELALYDRFASRFMVGDPRQTLYKWRGADGYQIFGKTPYETLSKSFRLPNAIAAAANQIDFGVAPKTVGVDREGEFAVEDVLAWIDRHSLIDATILCRSNRDVDETVRLLKSQNMPVLTAQEPSPLLGIYARWLAYTLNPTNDSLLAMYLRVLNKEIFQTADEVAVGRMIPLHQAIKVLTDQNGETIDITLTINDEMHQIIDPFVSLYPDERERLAAIYNQRYSVPDAVGFRVMTVHQAKGLEWNNVCFRIPRFFNETEENKWVLYTAMTRAKVRLCLDKGNLRVAKDWTPS